MEEYTLEEWVAKAGPSHRAVREFAEIKNRIRELEAVNTALKRKTQRHSCVVHGQVATWGCPYCLVDAGRERDLLKSTNSSLRAALERLSNNVHGIYTLCSEEIRLVAGNTNANCLETAMSEAQELLKEGGVSVQVNDTIDDYLKSLRWRVQELEATVKSLTGYNQLLGNAILRINKLESALREISQLLERQLAEWNGLESIRKPNPPDIYPDVIYAAEIARKALDKSDTPGSD